MDDATGARKESAIGWLARMMFARSIPVFKVPWGSISITWTSSAATGILPAIRPSQEKRPHLAAFVMFRRHFHKRLAHLRHRLLPKKTHRVNHVVIFRIEAGQPRVLQ